MTNDYFAKYVQSLTARSDRFNSLPSDTLHAIMGIVTEAGELMDILKKHAGYGVPLDKVHLKEEAGDALHYIQMLCNDQGWTLEELMQANVTKLALRYPNGFTKEVAIAQADKGE